MSGAPKRVQAKISRPAPIRIPSSEHQAQSHNSANTSCQPIPSFYSGNFFHNFTFFVERETRVNNREVPELLSLIRKHGGITIKSISRDTKPDYIVVLNPPNPPCGKDDKIINLTRRPPGVDTNDIEWSMENLIREFGEIVGESHFARKVVAKGWIHECITQKRRVGVDGWQLKGRFGALPHQPIDRQGTIPSKQTTPVSAIEGHPTTAYPPWLVKDPRVKRMQEKALEQFRKVQPLGTAVEGSIAHTSGVHDKIEKWRTPLLTQIPPSPRPSEEPRSPVKIPHYNLPTPSPSIDDHCMGLYDRAIRSPTSPLTSLGPTPSPEPEPPHDHAATRTDKTIIRADPAISPQHSLNDSDLDELMSDSEPRARQKSYESLTTGSCITTLKDVPTDERMEKTVGELQGEVGADISQMIDLTLSSSDDENEMSAGDDSCPSLYKTEFGTPMTMLVMGNRAERYKYGLLIKGGGGAVVEARRATCLIVGHSVVVLSQDQRALFAETKGLVPVLSAEWIDACTSMMKRVDHAPFVLDWDEPSNKVIRPKVKVEVTEARRSASPQPTARRSSSGPRLRDESRSVPFLRSQLSIGGRRMSEPCKRKRKRLKVPKEEGSSDGD